jgi:hypothetical protein
MCVGSEMLYGVLPVSRAPISKAEWLASKAQRYFGTTTLRHPGSMDDADKEALRAAIAYLYGTPARFQTAESVVLTDADEAAVHRVVATFMLGDDPAIAAYAWSEVDRQASPVAVHHRVVLASERVRSAYDAVVAALLKTDPQRQVPATVLIELRA